MATDRKDVLAAASQPITSAEGWEQVQRPTTGVKRPVSARVPEADSDWIINEAVRTKQTPSALIADLISEAIRARGIADGRVKVIEVEAVHRLIDSLAA